MAPVATATNLRVVRRPRDRETPLGYRDATAVLGQGQRPGHHGWQPSLGRPNDTGFEPIGTHMIGFDLDANMARTQTDLAPRSFAAIRL
jgi:hypothetical protein